MSEKRYAILIGINDYATDALSFSATDVDKLTSRLMSNCRFEPNDVYPIVSTKEKPHIDINGALIYAIKDINTKFRAGDTVLFYYSGHGLVSENGLILEIKEEKLAFQKVYDMIAELPAGRQFYILDACHAGAGAELKSTETEDYIDYFNDRLSIKSDGVQVFCSCKSDERSRAWGYLGNSVYTYYLIDAMDNRNFYDRELSSLSLMAMHEYATKKIDLARDPQTPVMISNSAGYYPFAFLGENQISNCAVTLNIHSEDEVYEFLNRPDLNFPETFKSNFASFMAELSLNLFNHNYSKGYDLIFDQNTVEIHDHSEQSFDPFTANITDNGQGVKVYKRFLETYQGQLNASYTPGKPNIIKLEFNRSVFENLAKDPCYLKVTETFLLSLTPLNQHDYDVECDNLIIDISRSHFPLSICPKMLDELLRRTERKKPMIIIKMAQNSMLRPDVANLLRYRGYKRILLV